MIAKKLHLKPGMRVAVANAPSGFSLGKPVGVAIEKSLKRDLDLVLLFATTQKELNAQWPKALASVKQDGALWVSYPKKNSGIQTDLGMGEWDATKGSDWNPVTTIGVDDTWSAVRFKYAPGLEAARDKRQTETITDGDCMVCVDREKRIVSISNSLSGGNWELHKVSAVGDPTHPVQRGGSAGASTGKRQRRVPVQGCMAACRVVVALELAKLPLKITAVPEQHMVEEFSAHRPNQALHEWM
jgi:hypothetical protein